MNAYRHVVLHLTDLHFGQDTGQDQTAARDLALRGLVKVIERLESDWRPTVVCISGDIGWKGNQNDYTLAAQWLSDLLRRLGLSPDRVYVCPGNHDIDRQISRRYARPKTGPEADRILAPPLAQMYQDAFKEFALFAKTLGIPPYCFGDRESYLIGQRSIDNLSICALNSAWFCQGADDQNNLWIGRPHVDILEHYHQLAIADGDGGSPTVLLMHHPREWFHDDEVHARGARPNTFDVIARRCQLMLTGHAHGESRRADRFAEAAWHINGGATYAGSDYQNGFTIIQVLEDRFVYRTFEYDPRSSDREWRQTIEATELPFRKSAPKQAVPSPQPAGDHIDSHRTASEANAQRVIEAKSRALRPWGSLPKTLPLAVRIYTQGIRPRFNQLGQLEQEKAVVSVSILQATQAARRSLLLGDLGSGKSTIAAGFVSEYQAATPRSLAVYVPAKSIQTAPDPAVPWKTTVDFLTAVSTYLNDEISPAGHTLNLQMLLEANVEIAVVVDGLDEVRQNVAQSILYHLASVVDRWSTTLVLATGRPVELAGVDYARWQLCVPASLTDEDRLTFFAQEAMADGIAPDNANNLAITALDNLRASPELHALANTPLFCRILFEELAKHSSGSSSLGDLLCNLIKQRLAEWAKHDSKGSSTPHFDALYPDADSRTALLSQLALRLHARGTVRIEEARRHLETLMSVVSTTLSPVLVEEALRSFENSGLIVVNNDVQFPLRPFEEFCCGYAHALNARSDPALLTPTEPTEWRIASFAATMARRFGMQHTTRNALMAFIRGLLQPSRNVPAAAYVVTEFRDVPLATTYIDELKILGRRPLWFAFDSPDWKQSAHVLAESLSLADEAGFVWFFDEYLDPRYPFVFAGSKVTDEVFESWAVIHLSHLSATQKTKLSSLVRPHMTAASHQVISIIPVLALLTPGEFTSDERLWFCSRLIDKPEFRETAERELREAIQRGEQEAVRNVLIDAASSGYEYAPTAALIHLAVFTGDPPIGLVRGIVRADRGRAAQNARQAGIRKLREVLGTGRLLRLLRWFLFDPDTMLAAGAAIELYELGERRLFFLGPALLRALHDGGYVKRAEEILSILVEEAGADGARWIGFHISHHSQELHGAHSGWWRILFKSISTVGSDGPHLIGRCMGAIGEFLLARYPEVRQGFRDLLMGPGGAVFRSALRDRLTDADPAIRHGAAMVLAASDPSTEARALEEVVRLKSRHRHGAWHEWERFCLSLKFGPSVISHLESRLGSFSAESEVFALAILYRNGVNLSEPQFERLVSGELEWLIGVDEPSQAPQARRSLGVLLKIAEGDANPLAIRAANKLLEHFSADLTPVQHARVVVLTLDTTNWRTPDFQNELLKMRQDSTYADLISTTSERLVSQGFARPTLELLYEAQTDPTHWEGVIWSELCTGVVGHDAEKHGQWILDFARDVPDQRGAVGTASRKFLFDPRVRQPHTQDAITWLALLADEGGQLSQNEIEEVIVQHSPISASALVALLARLGRIPANLRPRHSVGMPNTGHHRARPPATAPAFDALIEFGRPSETLHPQVCQTIEASLFGDPLTREQMDAIAEQSENGILIVGSLETAYGELPDPGLATAILGYRQPRPIAQDQCHSRLVEVWRRILDLGRGNKEWQARYSAELGRALSAGTGHTSAIAAALLATGQSLNSEQVTIVFRRLTEDIFDEHHLCAGLADWLSGEIPLEISSSLEFSSEQGLSALDGQPWDSDQSHPRDAGPYLLIPLVNWKMTGKTDERSKRVFLRGLRMALLPERQMPNRETRQQGIEDVYPLLAGTPKAVLLEVIQYGRFVEDVATRTLCRLFLLDLADPST